jgi:hypothetical protein
MINSETPSLTQTGTVEVSGWDEDEVFFVERSKLNWDEYAGKHVTLTRMLSEGCIIFVRPIQPTALYRANPIISGCIASTLLKEFHLAGIRRW